MDPPPDTPDAATCPARKRGRPPRGTEGERRDMVLAAAETIFLEQGFGSASMEAVSKLAGVSKKTIYAFFDAKEALFEAVMKVHTDSTDRPVPAAAPADGTAVETALADYLGRLAEFILQPFAVRLFRLTIAEAERFPDIAQAFYREGALRSIRQLEDWLALQTKNRLLKVEDPHEAAVFLTSMIVLEPLRAAALGVAELPSKAVMAARARSVTKVFLHGVS